MFKHLVPCLEFVGVNQQVIIFKLLGHHYPVVLLFISDFEPPYIITERFTFREIRYFVALGYVQDSYIASFTFITMLDGYSSFGVVYFLVFVKFEQVQVKVPFICYFFSIIL